MSSKHAQIKWTREGWAIFDLGSRHGVRVNGVHVDNGTVIGDGDVITLGGSLFFLGDYHTRSPSDLDAEDVTKTPTGLLTLQPTYGDTLADLQRLVQTRGSITLVGETGTGKEILARTIHTLSHRRGPYRAISCAEIAPTLITSELFGYVKGAFSGATSDHPGHIRGANLGTLMLDEILAAPSDLQSGLLRVLQEQHVQPVGAKNPIPIDVRFLCATQVPLEQAVKKGTFRPDLQARLGSYVCHLPALRERICDIGNIVALALRDLGVVERDEVVFSLPAAVALLRSEWRLNIRALVDAIRLAKHLADGPTIDDTHLPKTGEPSSADRLKAKIVAELRATNGNVSQAAKRLGRNRTLVNKWLKKIGIDPGQFRLRADAEVADADDS